MFEKYSRINKSSNERRGNKNKKKKLPAVDTDKLHNKESINMTVNKNYFNFYEQLTMQTQFPMTRNHSQY